jgi:NADH dehydrogenase
MTVTGLVVALFLYDASTYKDEADKEDIGVSDLALNPRRGGPKNLPIAEVLVSSGFYSCLVLSCWLMVIIGGR